MQFRPVAKPIQPTRPHGFLAAVAATGRTGGRIVVAEIRCAGWRLSARPGRVWAARVSRRGWAAVGRQWSVVTAYKGLYFNWASRWSARTVWQECR